MCNFLRSFACAFLLTKCHFFSRARKLLGKKSVADKPEVPRVFGAGEGEERGQRSGDETVAMV